MNGDVNTTGDQGMIATGQGQISDVTNTITKEHVLQHPDELSDQLKRLAERLRATTEGYAEQLEAINVVESAAAAASESGSEEAIARLSPLRKAQPSAKWVGGQAASISAMVAARAISIAMGMG